MTLCIHVYLPTYTSMYILYTYVYAYAYLNNIYVCVCIARFYFIFFLNFRRKTKYFLIFFRNFMKVETENKIFRFACTMYVHTYICIYICNYICMYVCMLKILEFSNFVANINIFFCRCF